MENLQDLLDYFDISNEKHYFEHINYAEAYADFDPDMTNCSNMFLDYFHYKYYVETLGMLEWGLPYLISPHQNQVSFYTNSKRLENFFFEEMMNLKTEYDKNPFAHVFTVDDFLNELYSKSIFEMLFSLFLNNNGIEIDNWYKKYIIPIKNKSYQERHESIEMIGKASEFDFSPGFHNSENVFHFEAFEEFFEPKIHQLYSLLESLVKIKIIQIAQKAASISSERNTELIKNNSPRTPKINEYPLVFKDVQSYKLFLYCINSYDTITKVLVSKYFEMFEDEEYIIKFCSLESFFKFINEKFNPNFSTPMTRIESYTSSITTKKNQFKNLESNFLHELD